MGRSPCCSKEGLNRGAWTALEDKILTDYIKTNGEGSWRNLPIKAGLKRCGKSCRLRWLNYLRPDIKRGNISHDEEELIIKLHKLLGNRWSLIAGRLPGRTDNEIKNYWNTNLSKKVQGHSNSNSSQKSSNQSREKKKPVTKPTVETTGSRVVRTKALRCTKVFFDPQAQNVETDGSIGKLGNGFSSFTPGEDNSSDFMMDFDNGEENCLSKLLDSDFSQLCDFEGVIGGDCNNENTTDDLSMTSDDHSLSFLNEILHNWTGSGDDSVQQDIQSLVTVLDSEEDWSGE